MKVAGFIANRIAFNRSPGRSGKKSFSRFIIRLSMVATVISVMVMIVTLSFANGFQETVSQKIFSFLGHIRIQSKMADRSANAAETPIFKNDSLVNTIRQMPGVKSIHPFSTRYAMLKTASEIEGVLVKGLDSTYDFNHFSRFLKQGRPIRFNDSTYSREIIISAYTAGQLQLKLDDRILIYFIRPDGSLRPDKLTITGIFKTGIEEYDKTFAIGDMKLIQHLNSARSNEAGGWKPGQISGYEIFLNHYQDMDKTASAIYELDAMHPDLEILRAFEMKEGMVPDDTDQASLQSLDAITARELAPNIFDWLNMQDVTRNVLIGIMVLVAVINLICCLIILVLERIKMIGVLKALGATDWTVQKIFLRHSILITLAGIIAGTLAALALLYLQQATGFIKLEEEAYYVSEAAVKIVWWQIGAIAAGTLLVCVFVLMVPTLLVRKIQPVRAIHFR